MAIGRRGFLKALGKGAAVGAAMATPAAGYSMGVDVAKGKDHTAFNFECRCGRNLVAEVPDTIGKTVSVRCDCGQLWEFQWRGDHFATYHPERPAKSVREELRANADKSRAEAFQVLDGHQKMADDTEYQKNLRNIGAAEESE